MIRARIAAIGGAAVVLVAAMFFPVTTAYTRWFGARSVATVTGCEPAGKAPRCHGTWIDAGGRHRSGVIAGVTDGTVGRVRIRTGPLGASAEGAWGWHR